MEPSAVLDGVRAWLDELADTEDRFAWLRDVWLEERHAAVRDSQAPGDPHEHADTRPEVLLRGEAGGPDVEELGERVDSEPTLGGHFDNAEFRRVATAGSVGVLRLELLSS